MSKKFKYDGKSRPTNDLYKENFDRIFKTNPVAKEVRTPKFKSKVIDSKKIYDRKKEQERIKRKLRYNLFVIDWNVQC
jgi:hypothetical protein